MTEGDQKKRVKKKLHRKEETKGEKRWSASQIFLSFRNPRERSRFFPHCLRNRSCKKKMEGFSLHPRQINHSSVDSDVFVDNNTANYHIPDRSSTVSARPRTRCPRGVERTTMTMTREEYIYVCVCVCACMRLGICGGDGRTGPS